MTFCKLRFVAYFLFGGLATIYYGCAMKPTPSIEFVFHDGFIGEAKIFTNMADGIDVKLIDNKYTINIPKDGVLRIKSDILSSWHTSSAKYSSGLILPYKNSTYGKQVSDDEIAVRSIGADSKGYTYIFVGTAKDYSKSN